MKKTTSKALASAALTALIAGIIPVGQVSAANTEFQRLSGKDRYLTAVEVSKAGWVEGADCAVVANGEAYADALSAAPFAKKNNAPVLLTSSKGITKETINELKRLKVKKVYVIGQTGVVPNSILEAIKKDVTADVERIGGLDRYATSTKIAEKLGTVTEAMLASGEGYADALSAAPVAAVKGIPVLLTKAGELPKATSDYIKAQGIKKTFVVGGTASVSDKVKGIVPDAVRIGGKNRFETNAEIIKNFALDFDFDGAYIALANGVTGKEFADALTASAIAAKGGHPVIISNKTADAATTALIEGKLSPTAKLTAIGGTANLSDALINAYKIKGETIEASKNVTGNAVVAKDGVELKDMKVTGNLYLEGNNATLNNVEVSGTVFVNPGAEGNAALTNVTAGKVVVLSGADKSIHFDNVKCDTLFVSSKTETRIVNDGPVDVKTIEIFSAVILDAQNPFKGTITVVDNLYVKDVQFLGKFEGTITLKGNDKIKLDGEMANVDVQGAAQIKTEAGTKVTIKITTEKAKESSKIDVPAGSGVKVEGAKEGNVTGDGAGEATKPSEPGNIGGGGGSTTTDILKDTIEKTIKNYDKFVKNNPDEVASYPTVKYANKIVTITMNETKEGKLVSETFDAKGENGIVTESRLKELDRLVSLTGINIGEKSLVQYIATSEALPNYINDGKINYGKIADDFKSGKFNFKYLEAAFNGLVDKMDGKENNTVPEVKVEGLTLQSISKKDGKTVTVNGNTYGKLAEDLKGMLGVEASYAELTYGDLAGTYSLNFKEGSKTVTYKIVINFTK